MMLQSRKVHRRKLKWLEVSPKCLTSTQETATGFLFPTNSQCHCIFFSPVNIVVAQPESSSYYSSPDEEGPLTLMK